MGGGTRRRRGVNTVGEDKEEEQDEAGMLKGDRINMGREDREKMDWDVVHINFSHEISRDDESIDTTHKIKTNYSYHKQGLQNEQTLRPCYHHHSVSN